MALPFYDRVVQHAINNVLEPIFDKRFISQSYACRKGKGMHAASDTLKEWLYEWNKYHPDQPLYAIKADIHHYFQSIDRAVLKTEIRKVIKDAGVLALLDRIIDHNGNMPDGVGIPVGNLTSQLFANIYLDALDQFIKHELGVEAYIRYMDDFVILSPDKEQLRNWLARIEQFLRENGFKVYLCREHHKDGQRAAHNCRETRELLCRIFQRKYEETHTREEFRALGIDDYKKKAEDYDALKTKSDGFEQQIAALNEEINGDGKKNIGYKKQLEEAQGKIKGYETSSLKMRIAHENGIPYELAGRLSGSDEEEIKKDAETMAKFLRKKDVPPLAGGDPQKIDDKKTAMKGMLASLKGE